MSLTKEEKTKLAVKEFHKELNKSGGMVIATKDELIELEDLRKQVAEANKILSEMFKNSELRCFDENGFIPCKANCARYYEELCSYIKALRFLFNANQQSNVKDSITEKQSQK